MGDADGTGGYPYLSRRERQIMDAVYELGEAGVAEVRAAIPDPPGYSAVRAQLRILEEKGHLRHEARGGRYIYSPTIPAGDARRSALRRILDTFFGGSAERAVAALLDMSSADLSPEELERLARLVDEARREEA